MYGASGGLDLPGRRVPTELAPETLDRIGRLCSPFEPLWFTVAAGLTEEADSLLRILICQAVALHERFGTGMPDLALYYLGFVAPLRMLMVGYLAIFTDEADALSHIPCSDQADVEQFNQWLRLHVRDLRSSVCDDPCGRAIFLCAEEAPFFSGRYYLAGVRAARITFQKYAWAFGARFEQQLAEGGAHG